MTSKPEVFIVESLSLDDEKEDRFEGDVLCKVLRLSGKEPIYRYIRTKRELAEFADEFDECEYRYLHFSMHADLNGVQLTFDHLSYHELCEVFGESLWKKRIFTSACKMANANFAELAIRKYEAYSIVGPERDIGFDDATVFWLAFYHLCFKADAEKMKRVQIEHAAENMSMLLEEPISYFTRSDDSRGFKKMTIHCNDPAH